MESATTAASNIRARAGKPPAESVRVIELHDGWSGRISGVVVTAVSNSHYALQPDAPGSTKRDTYSFRFDTPDRSIVYTGDTRSEEHTSELQSLMRISYAVFCLKKKNNKKHSKRQTQLT